MAAMTGWKCVALAVALPLVVSACSGGGKVVGGTSGKLAAGGTLTISVRQDPGNLDPQHTVLEVDNLFAAFGYDSIINQDGNGAPSAGLAEKWRQTGNTYNFTLREGITCSDGTAVTASTVAANIRYLIDPKSKSPLLGLYLPPGIKVSASDAARTVTLALAKPFPFFLTGLTGVPIVCAKGLSDRKSVAQATDGTGPYVLSQAVSDDHYTYTLRTGYAWGPGGATTAEK